MSDQKLVVSFGSGEPRPKNAQFAIITDVKRLTWDEVTRLLSSAPESEDKSSAGWYSFAEYDPVYRDSDNLVARYALTFDFDHITMEDVGRIRTAFRLFEYILYTTASHTKDAPRLRMVMPLTRPAGYDEFQAVSRMVASYAGIELPSRETHVPAQMMYMPTVKPGQKFKFTHNRGDWVDVDATLGEYADWTDTSSWPRRVDADGAQLGAQQTPPLEKDGVVGEFCRMFSIEDAIERFELPYELVHE